MLESIARTYSSVFAPELFVLLGVLVAVGLERRHAWAEALEPSDLEFAGLPPRVGAVALAWGLAFAVYVGLPTLVAGSPPWLDDVTGSIGLSIGMGLLWTVWRRRAWGDLVPRYAVALVAVSVPHVAIVPFWDLSAHVLYATTPVGVLLAADRRVAPLAIVPLGMVLARPLAGAHTWPEAVAGLLLGTIVLLVLHVGGVVGEPRRSPSA